MERMPGISIEPKGDPSIRGQRRNVVFQVTHRSPNESSSPESIGDKVVDSDSEGGDSGEIVAASTSGTGSDEERNDLRRESQIKVDNGEQTSPLPPSPPPKPVMVSPTRDAEGDNHIISQDPEYQDQENAAHTHGGERNKTNKNISSRNESEHNAVGGTEGGADEKRLRGYLPEVRWREVTVGDHVEVDADDDDEAGHCVWEAEERLRQHDFRQRILDK